MLSVPGGGGAGRGDVQRGQAQPEEQRPPAEVDGPEGSDTSRPLAGRSPLSPCAELCIWKFVFFFYINFIYFWLHWIIVAVRGLLTAVASLVVEHGF